MKENIQETTENIWKNYSARLLAFIKKRVSSEDAEDILQNVFIKIHDNLKFLNDKSKMESWIFAITRNAVNDYYRIKKKSDELTGHEEISDYFEEEDVRKELSECLLPMIESMPGRYGRALKMAELEGKKQKEIAEIENISLSGAKSRVQRGRVLLKEILMDCCNFEFDKQNRIISYEQKTSNCKKC